MYENGIPVPLFVNGSEKAYPSLETRILETEVSFLYGQQSGGCIG